MTKRQKNQRKIKAQQIAIRSQLSHLAHASWIISLFFLLISIIPLVSGIVVIYFEANPDVFKNDLFSFFLKEANLIAIIFSFIFLLAGMIQLILMSRLLKLNTKHKALSVFQLLFSIAIVLISLLFAACYIWYSIDPSFIIDFYKNYICYAYERFFGMVGTAYLTLSLIFGISAV